MGPKAASAPHLSSILFFVGLVSHRCDASNRERKAQTPALPRPVAPVVADNETAPEGDAYAPHRVLRTITPGRNFEHSLFVLWRDLCKLRDCRAAKGNFGMSSNSS